MTSHSKSYLDLKSDFLEAPHCVSVKGIKVVVPHDGGLEYIAAPSVQHEQRLVHLHGLVWIGDEHERKKLVIKNIHLL